MSLSIQGDALADEALIEALLRWPFMLLPILRRIDISPDSYSPLDWRAVFTTEYFRLARSRLPQGSVLEHIAEIYSVRNRIFWHRDVHVRWLYKCAMSAVEMANDKLMCDQVERWSSLSGSPALKKYSAANLEDYLEEFPRLPPEANPLDARFLAPGAPIIQPVRRRIDFADDGGRQELLERLMREVENGNEEQIQEILRGLPQEARGMLGRLGAEVNTDGVLNPEMPLLQLFLQTLLPWNRFDPRARDTPEEDD